MSYAHVQQIQDAATRAAVTKLWEAILQLERQVTGASPSAASVTALNARLDEIEETIRLVESVIGRRA